MRIGRDVFTETEQRYMYSFRPAGFIRSWRSLYTSKCLFGPWTLSRRRMVFGAVERGNRLDIGSSAFEGGIRGWNVSLPLGFGTLAVWGYLRGMPHAGAPD